MCSLCGMLGWQAHWTDSAGAPAAFADRVATHTRHRERQERTRLVNVVLKHYGLTLRDWSGTAYVLANGTGHTVLVDDLGQLWNAAERLTGRACDPLDERLIAALEPSG